MKNRPINRNRPKASLGPSKLFCALLGVPSALLCSNALAQQMYNGSTGYINTASAQMRTDGTMAVGLSQASPYLGLYVGLQALPWLEATGRFQQTTGVPDFVGTKGASYGSYKDKSIGFKLQALRENSFANPWLPAIALGIDDLGIGTQTFRSTYLVASKTADLPLGNIDISLGYGRQRIQGAFGGMRFTPHAYPQFSIVADYDRINFKNDVGAALVGLDKRSVGRFNAALEYRSPSSWGVQIGSRDGKPSINMNMSAPLGERTLSPKSAERDPYISFEPRPQKWKRGDFLLDSLAAALHADGFRRSKVKYDSNIVYASISSGKYVNASMAAGRAMRILLAHAPVDARKIHITYHVESMPALTYIAHDLDALQAYFTGSISHKELLRSMELVHASPDSTAPSKHTPSPAEQENLLSEATQHAQFKEIAENQTGLSYDRSFGAEYAGGSEWRVSPTADIYFNDPSGALKASVGLSARSRLTLAQGMSLETMVSATVWENISDVVQPSNSVLPHVRTDVANYYRQGRIKLKRMVLNQYWKPSDQIYARASAGIYELMYVGAGGQILYIPQGAAWSADLSADYLVQRDFTNPLKLLDYKVFSGFASAHIRLPYDMTGTVRAGRFLAKDVGLRFELKREFASGAQMGAWLSKTNGKDITSPGSVSNPYMDKGIFFSIPFDAFSKRYSGRIMNFDMSPWTRDVAQMVKSPGDLALVLERNVMHTLYQNKDFTGFSGLDVQD